jgi:hypothetical protein
MDAQDLKSNIAVTFGMRNKKPPRIGRGGFSSVESRLASLG